MFTAVAQPSQTMTATETALEPPHRNPNSLTLLEAVEAGKR